MKFDSSSWYVKAGLLRFFFFWDHVKVFVQTTHFVKSRRHSPRPTSKIIAMIALTRANFMKADPVVSLHANRSFSGRACSWKKDPCSLRVYQQMLSLLWPWDESERFLIPWFWSSWSLVWNSQKKDVCHKIFFEFAEYKILVYQKVVKQEIIFCDSVAVRINKLYM